MNRQDFFLLKALTGWQAVELTPPAAQPAPPDALQDLAEVTDHLDGIDTVTLDLFDTLLRRDVDPPDLPKRLAMQPLQLVLARHGVSIGIPALLALRDEAEARARQQGLTAGMDAECTLTDIFAQLYALLAERHGIDPAEHIAPAELVAYEVDRELTRLSPMPGARALLDELKRRGLKVLVLSDMYLEAAHLQRILSHHGLWEGIDALYVSSETRLTKGTGKIFAQLIARGEITPGATLHLGDHLVSDVQRPREHGLHSRLLHIPAEKARRAALRQALKLAEEFGEPGALRSLCELPDGSRSQADPRHIAYHRIGPLFTLFVLDVLRQCLAGDYREVFFLARDGHLLQRLYDKLRAGLDLARLLPSPAGRYLYLSRASTRHASLGDSPEELASLAQRVNRQDGVWSLIAILGLDRKDYAPLVSDILGTEAEDAALHDSGELQQRLLADPRFTQRLRQDLANGRRQLQDYLVQEGLLDGGRVMLVDIGWQGSILVTLEQAFGALPGFPDIDVRYFGRLHGNRLERIRLQDGFAFDSARDNPVEHLINECRELFESVASSTEGSVLRYTVGADGVIGPLCAPSTLDAEDLATLEQIQQGILDYCDDFIGLCNRFGPAPEPFYYDALVQATSLIAGTRPDEQERLAGLKFDLSWGTEGRVPLREYLGLSRQAGAAPPHQPLPLQLSLESAAGGTDLQALFERIHQLVERLRQEEQLVFYGVGTVSALLAPLLVERIAYFVDGNSALHGQQYLGKPIQAPDSLLDDSGKTVFVTPIKRKAVIAKRLAGCPLTVLYIDDLL